ncbi:DJ-1/PfpI family protein [Aliamphritea spongicola]|nr:DJ-1/PfpI family protein [Aliamphritea spongicola]
MKTLIRTACLLIVSCLALSQSVSAEDKKIGILVFDGVLTSDITAPLEVFGVASRQSWFSDYTPVVIAVKDTDSITTEEGLMLKTDSWIGANPEVDVLIVPSSYDMDPLLDDPKLISYIRHTAESAEWMASNCSGSFLLGEAGILDGKKPPPGRAAKLTFRMLTQRWTFSSTAMW